MIALCMLRKVTTPYTYTSKDRLIAIALLLPGFLPCMSDEVFNFGERFAIGLPLTVLMALPSYKPLSSINLQKRHISNYDFFIVTDVYFFIYL